MRRLVYVANARLPTEKAHGYAIVKLCEAFAKLGLAVELWHPRRRQLERLRGRGVFDFYGVEPSFTVRTLANLDVVRLDPLLPEALFRPLFVAHEAAWGRYVAHLAARDPADLYVTRDILVADALTRRDLPTILDVHETPARLRRRLLPRLAARDQLLRFVAVSQGNRDSLVAAGVTPQRIVVAGNAVDPELFQRLPDPATCRRTLGLPSDRPVIGYVGRFETLGQEKGIPTLIQAVGLLAQRHRPRPFLLCVGGPMDPVPRYLALARDAGLGPDDVRFIDHVPAWEVPRWIKALDVGVALYPPTDYGAKFTSPLKLYEYMAAGIAILASDFSTTRAAIGDYPAAVFVSCREPPGVSDAIASALELPPVHRWPVPAWTDRAGAMLDAVVRTTL